MRDIIPTSDTGIIACGFVIPALPDTGIQSAWVIKLDSIGCEWAGCDTTVGIEEHGGWEEETGRPGDREKSGSLVVFPNPTSGVLSV